MLQVEIKEKRMEKIKKVQEYFLYFMCYSVIGWLYEVFLEVVVYRWGFSNRGVLFGPYCVVYGFGAVILLLSLRPLMDKRIRIGKLCITPMLVFLGIVVITTLVELFASYLMEMTRGEWLWDYTRFAFHFQGRIALNPSIRFGIGGMVFLYILQPLFEKLIGKMSEKTFHVVFAVLAVLLCVDVGYFLLQ